MIYNLSILCFQSYTFSFKNVLCFTDFSGLAQ